MAGPKRARRGLLLTALALHGCGVQELRGPQTVRTLAYDPDLAAFILADRTLHRWLVGIPKPQAVCDHLFHRLPLRQR